jgi:hypothetical protein
LPPSEPRCVVINGLGGRLILWRILSVYNRFMAHKFLTSYLEDSLAVFRMYKSLGERAMAQVSDDQLQMAIDNGTLPIWSAAACCRFSSASLLAVISTSGVIAASKLA